MRLIPNVETKRRPKAVRLSEVLGRFWFRYPRTPALFLKHTAQHQRDAKLNRLAPRHPKERQQALQQSKRTWLAFYWENPLMRGANGSWISPANRYFKLPMKPKSM
ncbi:hypothetical protein [Jeongeupia sp. HS-3]|uniref:hypothetical protein n=1 Tax=Jeongeupia sp. HS-3 TaxID=1009682 RepID=UPI0019108FA5|nr:hypothetical protein [Jeongeupia sp. HS-3]